MSQYESWRIGHSEGAVAYEFTRRLPPLPTSNICDIGYITLKRAKNPPVPRFAES